MKLPLFLEFRILVILVLVGHTVTTSLVGSRRVTESDGGEHIQGQRAQTDKPHIIFILADDLGFNDVGWHARGGSLIETPNLDQLAYSGVRLENYYVQPKCSPTRSSLMTGRHVTSLGLQDVNLSPTDGICLPLDQKILPEKLRELGYATHAVGKWHLGFARKACLPTNRGFDSFFGEIYSPHPHVECGCGRRLTANGILTGTAKHFSHRRRSTHVKDFNGNAFYDNDTATNEYGGRFCGHLYTNRAKAIIYSHDVTQPLFLYVAFEMVHNPMTVPRRYKNRFRTIFNGKRRILAGQISFLDEAVANITAALKWRGLYRNSIIIFSSDNGGRLFQRSSNYPLRGEKGSLWEGGIRSAGFVHSPLLPPFVRGMTNRHLMHVSDWLPTLVEGVAGGNMSDPSIALDGFNMWSSIEKNARSPRKVILHNIDPTEPPHPWTGNDTSAWGDYRGLPFNPRRQAAIRIGKWKLLTGIQGPPYVGLPVESTEEPPTDEGEWNRAIRLYRVESDPGETNNLALEHPQKVIRMLRKLRQFDQRSKAPIRWKYHRLTKMSFTNDSWGPYLSDGGERRT